MIRNTLKRSFEKSIFRKAKWSRSIPSSSHQLSGVKFVKLAKSKNDHNFDTQSQQKHVYVRNLNRWSKKKQSLRNTLDTDIQSQTCGTAPLDAPPSSVCPRLPKILWEQWIVELPLQALHDSKLHRITDHQLSNHTTQPHSAIHLHQCWHHALRSFTCYIKDIQALPIMELWNAASWKESRIKS